MIWWTGAQVFRVKMALLVVRTEPLTNVHVHRDGREKSAMSKWFPAKLLPILEELRCLDCVRTVEGAEILELRIHVTVEMDTGDRTASTNQTPVPAIPAIMEQHATT